MPMVQYGLFPNCSNQCDFCLLKERDYLPKEQVLHRLKYVNENISHIDWKGQFSDGISLLGGELYYHTDPEIQEAFMKIIDTIIEYVLSVSENPACRYSTVTNGIYQPDFLFRVMDRFKETVGMDKVDLNFSYDLKYRFHSEESRLLCLDNIKKFNERYDKPCNVQMILTQHLINVYNSGEFDFDKCIKDDLNGNSLNLLYPHKVRTGKKLDEFFFKRHDFLMFMRELHKKYPVMCMNFYHSVINSSIFKYSGYYNRETDDTTQQPVLEVDKATINQNCGHSQLYQCYADSDECMLCDLVEMFE